MNILLIPPKYRPDIDGLRAIAVLSVIGYHAFPDKLKGGFIGVDVFFVISGYLISTILFEKLENDTFSFKEFYARRIKRIFPALFLVLSSSYIIGWFFLLSDEFMQLGKHIAGGAGFVSNLVFLNEIGYFDSAAETKLLLHLWSLGVEEQFYIIYPILLCLSFRNNKMFLVITVVLGALSFYINVKGVKIDNEVNFYSPKSLFWELMAGSILAWINLYSKNYFQNNKILNGYYNIIIKNFNQKFYNTISIIGISLLLYGFLFINSNFYFPGYWALIPVSGAFLIIAAGDQSWINKKILSSKIAVWFGIISFPLYLWHWVLLTFPRIILAEHPKRVVIWCVIALSIILAWLTTVLIERPIRMQNRDGKTSAVLLIMMMLIGLVGFSTYIKGDHLFLNNSRNKSILIGDTGHIEYHRYIADQYSLCTPNHIAIKSLQWDGYTRCMQSKFDKNIDIALIGDSHAEHLFLGMAESLPDHNIVFYIKGSPLFLNNNDYEDIINEVVNNKNIKTVFITMYWFSRAKKIPSGSTLDIEMIKIVDLFLASNKKVFLIGDVPSFNFSPERCKRDYINENTKSCRITIEEAKLQSHVYHENLLKVVQLRPSVVYVPIEQHICDRELCSMFKGNFILYRDKNHLNLVGSSLIGKKIIEENNYYFKKAL